jgi:hypothetical protein
MIVLGIPLLVIGFLAKIAIVWTIGGIARVVGILLVPSARSAIRWAPTAIAGDDATHGPTGTRTA